MDFRRLINSVNPAAQYIHVYCMEEMGFTHPTGQGSIGGNYQCWQDKFKTVNCK
jgi:hypothetical protein